MSRRKIVPRSKWGNPLPPKEGIKCHCGKAALYLVTTAGWTGGESGREQLGYCAVHKNEASEATARQNAMRCWKSDYRDDKRTEQAKHRDNRKYRHVLQ